MPPVIGQVSKVVIGSDAAGIRGRASRRFTVSQLRPAWYWKRRHEIMNQCDKTRERPMRPITFAERHRWRMALHLRLAASARNWTISSSSAQNGLNARGLLPAGFEPCRRRCDGRPGAELENRLAQVDEAERHQKRRQRQLRAPQGIAEVRLTRISSTEFPSLSKCMFWFPANFVREPVVYAPFHKVIHNPMCFS